MPLLNSAPTTLFDKIWASRQIVELGDGEAILHVDRHLLHDLSGVLAARDLKGRVKKLARPDLTFATQDHTVSSDPQLRHREGGFPTEFRKLCSDWQVRLFDVSDEEQGIVHVIAPELGLALPGLLIACGDSHTATNGALGALSFGIGTSDVAHVLAMQCLVRRKPKQMRISISGTLAPYVSAKDVILHLIGAQGNAAANGYVVEFAGPAVSAMAMEQRFTLCNMVVEMGAQSALIAPDETTFRYIEGRRYTPKHEAWTDALAHWRSLATDEAASFDREIGFDVSSLEPQVTWGTSVDQVVSIGGHVPMPNSPEGCQEVAEAMRYMDLVAGQKISGIPIDRVFIGSCTNGRISDLREAAAIVNGKHVAAHVEAWVAPGSTYVRHQAQAEGLDRVFIDAGFQWREAACSLCSAANGETVGDQKRCVSTSNRNFVGRQGVGARTHLASPAVAAASAIAGHIADPRTFVDR